MKYHDSEKMFCKSLDGGFGRSMMHRKGKSITRKSSTPVRVKLSLPWRKLSSIANLPPGHGLVTSGKDVISAAAQCWSLQLAYLALSSSCSQGSIGEQKSMLMSPCISPISATMATCSWAMTGKTEKRG